MEQIERKIKHSSVDSLLNLNSFYRFSNFCSISFKKNVWNNGKREFWKKFQHASTTASLLCSQEIDQTIQHIGTDNLDLKATYNNWTERANRTSTSFEDSFQNTFDIKLNSQLKIY